MNYAIKITSEGGDTIEIGDASAVNNQDLIKSVDIFFDTIDDDVRQKASGMLAKITIGGKIDIGIQSELMKIFEWSKALESDKWYRDLEIVIYEGGTTVRNYIIPSVFVVDYKEMYRVSGTNANDEFELKLTQKQNNFDKIETF